MNPSPPETPSTETSDEPSVDDGPMASASFGATLLRILLSVGVVAFVFAYLLPKVVDYDSVFNTLADLTWSQLTLILLAAAGRVVVESTVYIAVLPGLKLRRAILAFLSSTAVASTIPGPFDMAVRFGMYRVWGFSVTESTVAIFASGLFSFGVKLLVPVLAVLILLAQGSASGSAALLAGLGVVVFGIGALVVFFAVRSEPFARRLGEWVDRIVNAVLHRFHRAPLDLTDQLLEARRDSIELLGGRWKLAVVSLLGTQITMVVILALSLRFSGVPESEINLAQVFAAFAFVQLITMIPITPGSAGVAEVSYIAILGTMAGPGWNDQITAAVFLFRIATWFVILPTGWGSLFGWFYLRKRRGDTVGSLLNPQPAT